MFSGVCIALIIHLQQNTPNMQSIMLSSKHAVNAVVTARLTPFLSPAPNNLETTTDVPRFIPTAKAIKMIVHNGDMEQRLPELTGNDADKPDGVKKHQVYFKNPETLALAEAKQSILDNTDRMAQFTELMTDIVGKAIAANNESLSKTISEDVGEQVLKEMNYLMREREELEEERFRQLDEAIRGNLKKKKTPLLKKWTKKKPSEA